MQNQNKQTNKRTISLLIPKSENCKSEWVGQFHDNNREIEYQL